MDEHEKSRLEEKRRREKRVIVSISIGIVAVIIILSSFGTVRAGWRGVRTRFGAVTGNVVGQGLYLKLPFIESVVKMNVQVQKEQVDVGAASSDLQTVDSTIALNYHPDPEKITQLYQGIGLNYKDAIIAPALQEAVKASTARYTAEELITKRELVKADVRSTISEKLVIRGIIVDDLNIVNFDFSDSFNAAIEAKVTAEQSALAAKNKLAQVQFEAQQAQAEATGKAQAITIESEALRNNPQVLELRALEKWNGVLPQVTSGAIPFISVK